MYQKTDSLIEKLRCATSECHDRLHEHPVTSVLIDENIQLQDYLIVLFAFQRFYENIMREAFKIDRHFSLEQIKRIENDLSYLGFERNPMRACNYLKLPDGMDTLWGVLYVTEGSRLGGQLIAKNVEKILHLKKARGNSFFAAGGKFTAKKWNSFIQNMSQSVKNEDICVQSANLVFQALEKWLWHVHQSSFELIEVQN